MVKLSDGRGNLSKFRDGDLIREVECDCSCGSELELNILNNAIELAKDVGRLQNQTSELSMKLSI